MCDLWAETRDRLVLASGTWYRPRRGTVFVSRASTPPEMPKARAEEEKPGPVYIPPDDGKVHIVPVRLKLRHPTPDRSARGE
jgi:hypothetical protein